MDLALNNLQKLICHKTQQTKPNQLAFPDLQTVPLQSSSSRMRMCVCECVCVCVCVRVCVYLIRTHPLIPISWCTYGEKVRRQLHKIVASNIEQVLEAVPNKAAAVRPPTTHHKNYPS